MNNGNTALAKVEDSTRSMVEHSGYEGLQMVVSPAEALRRVQELQAFVAKVMTPGIDFGTIPGTDKPSLFQPGAQKLSELYGFAWQFVDDGSIQDWKEPLFAFRKRCVLTSRRDGSYVGDGIGSCNSREDRYAWRWVKYAPAGVAKEHLVTKTGKYGTQYRTPNPDLYSLVNTIEKMACKRAFVHAVIGATRSSGVFTQDVEDLPREVFGQPEAERSWEKGEEKAPTPIVTPDQAIAHGKPLRSEDDKRKYWMSIADSRKTWSKADSERALAAIKGEPVKAARPPVSAESDAAPEAEYEPGADG